MDSDQEMCKIAEQEQRQPGYRLVNRESDLTDLIPGDRVKVSNDKRIKWMVYQKMDHGEGNEGLNHQSEAFFIQIPDGHKGEDDAQFDLWRSYVKHLQFEKGTVYINYYHRNLTQVKPGTEQHAELKTLADMLVK